MKPEFERLIFEPVADAEMIDRASAFRRMTATRRTVRSFSSEAVPYEVIEHALSAAGSAPSGANQQPWRFVVVADPEVKRRIRLAAEEEERAFYSHRAPEEWLDALAPLGVDAEKPFLESAPYLIAIFVEQFGVTPDGLREKRYYPVESVGIATGFLIAGLHAAGLATLTHTPSPMRFLNELLERPPNERPFLLLVVGRPSADCLVPKIQKKSLAETVTLK